MYVHRRNLANGREMSGWQPKRNDPGRPVTPPQFRDRAPQHGRDGYGQIPSVPQPQRPSAPRDHRPPQQAAQRARKTALTGAEGFWYILECIAFGAGYLCKVPVKKALQDAGMAQMTAAEQLWYVLMCIAFGGGYFAKIPVANALSEMQPQRGYR